MQAKSTIILPAMNYIGVDIIEISRIERVIACWGGAFLRRVYTCPELKICGKKPSSLAARFAAKEAVVKALGAKNKGIGWKEIEILADPDGKPLVRLHSRAQSYAKGLGLAGLAISLSHSKEYAIAFVTGETG